MKGIIHHVTVNGKPYCQSGLYLRDQIDHCDYLSKAAALRKMREARKRAARGVRVKVERGPCPVA